MKLCDAKYCMGCGACEQICPSNAIELLEDREGFLQPYITDEKCTDCGKCAQICPMLKIVSNSSETVSCYAAKANNIIREKTSSGGVFAILSEYIINELKGYVCGAVWNEKFQVEHIITNQIKDVERMYGSKYIQSKIGNMYSDIEKLLINKQTVLFSGTPCQIAGIKAYLQKEYDELYLVDVICHGISSYKVLNHYLEDTFPGKKIESISFRDKSYFRWSESLNIRFEDGQIYRNSSTQDSYLEVLKKGYSLRQSCGENCFYNMKSRCSDITLGDFWAVGDYDIRNKTRLFDNAGTSSIAVNSPKGQRILKNCKEKFIVLTEINMKDLDERNYFVLPFLYSMEKRNHFFRLFEQFSFKKAYEAVIQDRHDIALLGLWNGGNYGAIITANALYEILNDQGYEVVFIDTSISNGLRDDELLKYITDRCIVSNKYTDGSDMIELNKQFDTFLIGSDQCWNNSLNSMYHNIFMLDFVRDSKKKVSYSTSFGFGDFNGSVDEKVNYEHFLKRFDAVSVREDSGVKLCTTLAGIEAKCVLDPILLRSLEAYRSEIENIELEEEFFVLNYLLDIRPTTMNLVKEENRKSGMEKTVCILGLDYTNPWDENIDNVIEKPSVYEFIAYFMKSSYIVTDSYHGMCLAILFNKPFKVIVNVGRGRDRFDSLLKRLNLETLAVEYETTKQPEENPVISWSEVNEKLEDFKKESIMWLKEVLIREKPPQITMEDLLRDQIYEQHKKIKEQQNKLIVLEEKMYTFKEKVLNPKVSRIQEYFEEKLTPNSRVVIRGGGLHTKRLLECILPILYKKNIRFVIMDKKAGTIEVAGEVYNVILPSEIIIKSADFVVVSTLKYRNEVFTEIRKISENIKTDRPVIVELYRELNLEVSHPFYLEKEVRGE